MDNKYKGLPKKADGKIDFDAITMEALYNLERLVAEWYPDGDVRGNEYVALNVTRGDQNKGSFSINLDTGLWNDLATNDNGNILQLAMYRFGYDIKDAALYVAEELNMVSTTTESEPDAIAEMRRLSDNLWYAIDKERRDKERAEKELLKPQPIVPVPDDAALPPSLKGDNTRWEYKNADGQTLLYVYRINSVKDGKPHKDYYPVTYCHMPEPEDDRLEFKWKFKGLNKTTLKPLYNLDKIAKFNKRPIMMVEGEKCADAARGLFKKDYVTTTIQSGVGSFNKADLSPLKDRDVTYWPDNDEAGMNGALNLEKALKGIASSFAIVEPPADVPKKWDLADAVDDGWDKERVMKHILENIKEEVIEEEVIVPAGHTKDGDIIFPFRCLGYDTESGTNYYLISSKGSVIGIQTAQHVEAQLTGDLASVYFWREHWPVFRKKDGTTEAPKKKTDDEEDERKPHDADWKAIKDQLIAMQVEVGPYNDDDIRKKGVWIDDGRTVVHLGSHLIVDGVKTALGGIVTKFIYKRDTATDTHMPIPTTVSKSRELLDICRSFSWKNGNGSGDLLGGWMVASLVGGSLPWRPHMWLNGPAGCGKSTILNEIIGQVLGDCVAASVGGETSAAGIRQNVHGCSFPILYDEAESNDQKGKNNMNNILELMRGAASPAGSLTIKGTATGESKSFRMRNCFCLASIGHIITNSADKSRIVNLELIESSNEESWMETQVKIDNVLTDDFTASFRARIFSMVPTILANIDIYRTLVKQETGNQRYSDVYGVLLGSMEALRIDGLVDTADALEQVKGMDWNVVKHNINTEKDEIKCLREIMHSIINADGHETSVLEVINSLNSIEPANDSAKRQWNDRTDHDAIMRRGIAFKRGRGSNGDYVAIQNENKLLSRMLSDTPFSANWNMILGRLNANINGEVVRTRQSRNVTYKTEVSKESCDVLAIPIELVQYFLGDGSKDEA